MVRTVSTCMPADARRLSTSPSLSSDATGSLVLLSPSFSRKDESMFPRALDRFSRVLGSTPHVSLVEISDAGHFTLNQKPSEIAALVLDAVASTARN